MRQIQGLADFLVELPKDDPEVTITNGVWTLKVDGASSKQGTGVTIHLISPHGEVIEQSSRLNFIASNNEAEDESLIFGLQLVKTAWSHT